MKAVTPVALLALVAVAALGVGFYAGMNVSELRTTRPPVREAAAVRRHLAESYGQFESRDGGATWAAVIDGERRELRIAGADTGRLFASDKQGLYESRDGGGTWSPVGDADDLRTHPWKLLNAPQSK